MIFVLSLGWGTLPYLTAPSSGVAIATEGRCKQTRAGDVSETSGGHEVSWGGGASAGVGWSFGCREWGFGFGGGTSAGVSGWSFGCREWGFGFGGGTSAWGGASGVGSGALGGTSAGGVELQV